MDNKAQATEEEIKQYLWDSLEEPEKNLLSEWIVGIKERQAYLEERKCLGVIIQVVPGRRNGVIRAIERLLGNV